MTDSVDDVGESPALLLTPAAAPREPLAPGVFEQPGYEVRLDRDPRWALSEGSRHFEEQSAVFLALHKIAARLKLLDIPYAVIGGMALFRHGLRRFTEGVDILVTKPGLKRIHEELSGRGYLPPFERSRHLRDTESGVKIEFLTTGDFPGDGKPKPVSFPDPEPVSFEADGVRYISLEKLIELKLASGMTNVGRLKDLADVLELVKILNLPASFAAQLNPFVQDKFRELQREARRRFVRRWPLDGLNLPGGSVAERIAALAGAASSELDQMLRDGVTVAEPDGLTNDFVLLVTDDPRIAAEWEMVEESELWDQDL